MTPVSIPSAQFLPKVYLLCDTEHLSHANWDPVAHGQKRYTWYGILLEQILTWFSHLDFWWDKFENKIQNTMLLTWS